MTYVHPLPPARPMWLLGSLDLYEHLRYLRLLGESQKHCVNQTSHHYVFTNTGTSNAWV